MKNRTNKKSRKSRRLDLTARTQGTRERALAPIPGGLTTPPSPALARWHAIPLLFGGSASTPLIAGQVGFDSWAGAAVGLRDLDDGHVRRVRFEAGHITLELVAERRGSGWEFVARVYSKDLVAHEFVLEAGRKRILPSADGFYLWTSSALLRRLRLIALDRQIDFGGLKW